MANITDGRCFSQRALSEPPLIQHGSLVLQAHDIGWIISGSFTVVAIGISLWLIDKHLRWYTNTHEQRYIIRILFMVPIYAVISFASYLFWNHSTPLLLIRDCYEAIVLTAFFYLLLMYLSPDYEAQKAIFYQCGLSRKKDQQADMCGLAKDKWIFPLQLIRWKPMDGLHFLQIMKWGVLQYCLIRPVTTLVAVILNYIGLYCEDSWSPGWGHLYITVIMSISVTVAMYCLLQLYVCISVNLQPHKPLLKLFVVKAIVFLTFWQATLLLLLESFNVIKSSTYMTADNITTGISAILETFEMVVFAVLHIRAYSYQPYYGHAQQQSYWKALAHAFDFTETGIEVWKGIVYWVKTRQGRETDVQARREVALMEALGASRIRAYNEKVPSVSGNASYSMVMSEDAETN
ncbi:DUF300-domain-containing protein [Wolfiporia cocos MD-104 SS10]|uniref:DUF300-domain-containing protein n=1 Tax=Wolfiporia cocos (strain MD-104) TaxID=742152 RepID=A0A2H3JG99_WOLCO|nr:DUF300-domain-containing protein [Wolfiporia cocos MD-104 SS10]